MGTLTFKANPLGGMFLVLRVRGSEQLNRLPEYVVETVGDVVPLTAEALPVTLAMLMADKAEVEMDEDNDYKRYFGGYVVRVDHGERHGRYERWNFTLRPWLWFATRTRNSRVFQKKSVKEIVTEVLQEYSTDSAWELESESAYPKLDYCVQYDESDFDFVSRLLERAGINYFFVYESGKHTLTFVDANAKFKSKERTDTVKWQNALRDDGNVADWRSSEEVRVLKAVVHDFDYLATATEIKGEKEPGFAEMALAKDLGPSEVFEYPADVVQNSQLEEAQTSSGDAATKRAELLLESLNSMQKAAVAKCNVRDIAVGATFKVEDLPDSSQNGEWVVVGANFKVEYGQHSGVRDLAEQQRGRDGFQATIWCCKVDGSNVRPEVLTPKPMMRGPQTAVVVGPSGDEIHTDKHGRVKVQFHWDRLGEKNENSSCWVRVASPWASKNFGALSIPRIGDEVLVTFLEGDPDKPLVVGSVWNDVSAPIWELPANATMSGIKTRTSKEGDFDKGNELRFEDKKDSEYVWLQAEKDFYRYVEKKSYEWIGEDEHVKVVKNRKEVVGEGWSVDVTKDVMHNYGKDFHTNVAGDILIKGGATWQLDLTKDMVVAAGGDYGFDSKGKVQIKAASGVVIDCSSGITLKCGGSIVSLTSGGVDIVGSVVKVNSGGGGESASPPAPAEAKKLEDITSAKASDYDKLFEDRYKKSA